MNRWISSLLIVGLLLTAANTASAFDFQEELKKMAQTNAEGYITGLPTAFGMAMNSGLYHAASIKNGGIPFINLDVYVKMSIVQVGEEDKTFDFFVGDQYPLIVNGNNLTLNPSILYPDRTTPTVWGVDSAASISATDSSFEQALLDAGLTPNDVTLLRNTGQFNSLLANIPVIVTPPGSGNDLLPLPMPQVSIGLPFSSELTARYLPPTKAGEFGEVSLVGLGLKHNISHYIPLPSILLPDISVQAMWQQLKLGDVLESTHIAYNLHASYGINLIILSITPYVGIGMESSNLKIDYTANAPGTVFHDQQISFDLDGENRSRITGGVRLGVVIPFLKVTADISVGKYQAVTLGIGLSI